MSDETDQTRALKLIAAAGIDGAKPLVSAVALLIRERDEARAALREAIALARDMNEGDAYDRWRRALGEEQDA